MAEPVKKGIYRAKTGLMCYSNKEQVRDALYQENCTNTAEGFGRKGQYMKDVEQLGRAT